MNQPAASGGLGVASMPEFDFSAYGEIETAELSRINKLTGQNLHRNWVTIPHVTQFDKADITDLERFRKELNAEQNGDTKVTVRDRKGNVSYRGPWNNEEDKAAVEPAIRERIENMGVSRRGNELKFWMGQPGGR
jgi:hypothetical protein